MERIRQTIAALLYRIAARIEPLTDEQLEAGLELVYGRCDRYKGVALTPLREDCEACSRRIVAGFEVDRAVWRAVAGERRALCLACFDEMAEAARVRYVVRSLAEWPWHALSNS